jgi:HD-like signal output (HDOD) protein
MNSNPNQFFDAVSKIERLSPAPRILGRAISLLKDPESNIDDIATLIKSDPALVTDMIRGANSVMYGGTERVSSLERALQKIGFSESIRLLNLAVTRIFASRNLESYGMAADDFWAESLFSGIFLRALATITSGVEPDEAHTAGLLRFIGRLAVEQCLKDLGSGAHWDGIKQLEDWELEQAGFSNAQASAALLRSWKFPENLIQALQWQNQPTSAPTPSWLANALDFSSAVLPQGLGLSFAVLASNYEVQTLPDTDFARQHDMTVERITKLVDTSRREFIAIASKLYDYRKASPG